MSEQHNQHGKREAPGPGSSLALWWQQHRMWVAGLDRRGKIRYRLFQVLVVAAILIIAVYLFLRSWIRLPDVPTPPVSGLNPSGSSSAGDISAGDLSFEGAELPDVIKSGRKEGYYTFLLCGKDVVSGSTDTMILITYDTKGQKIDAVSLLRDTMVNTSGKTGGQKRLNTVYTRNLGDKTLSDKERTENGMTALKKEVSHLTGVYPDFYVLVEWEAIGRLVDAIGGVEFEVPFLMNYRDPYQDLVIYQEPGLRKLDGDDAMQVIRFRKNSDGTHSLGDVGRTQIQRDFLTAVLKKCLTPEILLKLPTLVDIFMDNVSTDLTVGNILAFAQLAIGMDTEKNVTFQSMPCYLVTYKGASLVCAQEKDLLELLNAGINPYQDDIKSSDLQLMYKKSGGGFGVTNGSLLDTAVAQAPVTTPKPAGPVETGGPDDPAVTDPGGGTPGTNSGGDTDPGGTAGPGGVTIAPGDIFPSTDIRGESDAAQAA